MAGASFVRAATTGAILIASGRVPMTTRTRATLPSLLSDRLELVTDFGHLLRYETEPEEEEAERLEQHHEVQERAVPHGRNVGIEPEHGVQEAQIDRHHGDHHAEHRECEAAATEQEQRLPGEQEQEPHRDEVDHAHEDAERALELRHPCPTRMQVDV